MTVAEREFENNVLRSRILDMSADEGRQSEFQRVQSRKAELVQLKRVCGLAFRPGCRAEAVDALTVLSQQYPFLCFTRHGNFCDGLRRSDREAYRQGRHMWAEMERFRRQQAGNQLQDAEQVDLVRLREIAAQTPRACRYLRPDWTVCEN